MDEKLLDRLFEVLDDLVAADAPYKEKAEAILRYADSAEGARTLLEEFLGWFEAIPQEQPGD